MHEENQLSKRSFSLCLLSFKPALFFCLFSSPFISIFKIKFSSKNIFERIEWPVEQLDLVVEEHVDHRMVEQQIHVLYLENQ